MFMKVGCCGFPFRKKDYYQSFSLVEIQQTFYRMPMVRTLRRWREEAPSDFEFALKANQRITHPARSPTYKKAGRDVEGVDKEKVGCFKNTAEVFRAWEETREAAEILDTRIIVFQTPPSFKEKERNVRRLKGFFTSIDRGGLKLGWEPRGWSVKKAHNLCHELELVPVYDPLYQDFNPGKIAYFRLHGAYRDNRMIYRHRYSDKELQGLGQKIDVLKSSQVYVLFNNSNMAEDARRFMGML